MSTPNPAGVPAEAPVADALPLRSLNVSLSRDKIRVSLSSFGNVGRNSTGQTSDFKQEVSHDKLDNWQRDRQQQGTGPR